MALTKNRKLYLIGIDAAPLWIIKENYKKYKMDGFARFFDEGILTELESTLPPMTGPSWPSMYTGVRPGVHGIPDFFTLKSNYTKEVAYYDPEIIEPFWERLGKDGIRSLLITPAMAVRLPKSENVDMMTGFPLPPRFSSEEIRRAAKKYGFEGEPNIEKMIKSKEMSLAEASKRYVESIKKRGELAKHLMLRNNYELSFICFTETDRIQHFSLNLPEWKSYVLPLYQEISKFLEWTVENAEKEGARIMLVSDHGAQPIKSKFLMNAWLINNGYARLKQEIEEQNKKTGGNSSNLKYTVREKIIRSRLRKVYDKLPNMGKSVAKDVLGNLLVASSGEDYTRIHDFDFDMKRTVAFSSISNWTVCSIYINDSRFDEGVVSVTKKRAIKNELIRKLMLVNDENGNKLMVRAFDADKYYEGTQMFIAPDVMVEIKKGYFIDVFGYLKSGGLFMKPEMAKRGDHTNEGIFGAISYGDGGRKTTKHPASNPSVYQINPTVLSYFGIPPENDRRYRKIL